MYNSFQFLLTYFVHSIWHGLRHKISTSSLPFCCVTIFHHLCARCLVSILIHCKNTSPLREKFFRWSDTLLTTSFILRVEDAWSSLVRIHPDTWDFPKFQKSWKIWLICLIFLLIIANLKKIEMYEPQMVTHLSIIHGFGCLTSVTWQFTMNWPFTFTVFTLSHACSVQMLFVSKIDDI